VEGFYSINGLNDAWFLARFYSTKWYPWYFEGDLARKVRFLLCGHVMCQPFTSAKAETLSKAFERSWCSDQAQSYVSHHWVFRCLRRQTLKLGLIHSIWEESSARKTSMLMISMFLQHQILNKETVMPFHATCRSSSAEICTAMIYNSFPVTVQVESSQTNAFVQLSQDQEPPAAFIRASRKKERPS